MSRQEGQVLVVDDDEDIRDLVAMVLEVSGYSVAKASSGREALAYLRSHRLPALMLLDLRMPDMAGDEVVEVVRNDSRLADLPIVVVSGDGAARKRAEKLPVQGALLKPVGVEALLSMVVLFVSAASLAADQPGASPH